MKKSTNLVLAGLAIGLTAAVGRLALAQTPNPTTPAADAPHPGNLKWLAAELNLSPMQAAQIKPVLKGLRQEVKGIKANTTLTEPQKKTEIKQDRKSAFEQIATFLTPAQRQQLRAILAERRKQA